ncbi:multidrug effflux MFS transporter [Qingshengfaniella alkalisoli]|uniref:Multidrug effflux MFS transporter n=1 Tax=Qingshengfaniella alkalisoli TaxID=2599296 RepID=A0A5B8I6H8_9RHOB|nr:multidrug effflux MFS transporter [Qingshengfaniella alkalisoli]QDY69029.1 multidrug effflux MFS transporter [Qingshengfaniella alkalisoli]
MISRRHPSKSEFIFLMAMTMAIIAFSIDSMLPAMPSIAAELSPLDPNRAQLIITSFMLGMGVGTLFSGPISDAVGRKPVMLGGAVVYCAGAALAWHAPSMEVMLAARVLQGIGGSGPRVVVMAIIRDTYAGRSMARIVSLVMIVFALVPALAPTIGAGIIHFVGWRGLFPAYIAFAMIAAVWLLIRQPETHAKEKRNPLYPRTLLRALKEVVSHRTVRITIAVQMLVFATMFTTLSSTQMVFDQTFGRGSEFPFWFAVIALMSTVGGMINATLVVRIGMRRVVVGALTMQAAMCAFYLFGALFDIWSAHAQFYVYLLWVLSIFVMIGLTLGNLNALALEPMGHVAGMAASVVSCLATIGGVAIAAPLGLRFDGTAVPLAEGILPCIALALFLTTRLKD